MERFLYSETLKLAHFLIRIRKNFVHFGRFQKIEIFSDKEILNFEGQHTQGSYPVHTNIA